MNDLLKKDISVKAVSILMAVIFWFYVLNVDNPYVLRRITIQLKVENENSLQQKGLVLKNKYNNTVEITVRGREEIINTLNASDFVAVVDFSKIKSADDKSIRIDGPYHNIKDITIPVVSPRTINLELEKIKKNSFAIDLKLDGTLKSGYQILNSKLTPESISFEDVQSVVDSIGSVKSVVDINGLDRDIDRKIDCKVYGKDGKEITWLSKNLTASLKVEVAKQVAVVPVVSGKPAQDYIKTGETIVPQTALIRGSPDVLEKITELKTEPVNIDNVDRNVDAAAKIKLPEGVQLVNTPKEVAVNVNVEKLATKEFSISSDKMEMVGKGPLDYEIKTSEVKASIKGRIQDLNNLNAADLKAYIDVTGLKEGTHKIHLKVDLPLAYTLNGEYEVEVKISRPQT